MATSMPGALVAQDSERDAGMSNPGTSAGLPGIADLCHMFDNHIEQLGKLKETAMKNEQEQSSKVWSLEQEKIERDEKITRLEQENIALKENCRVLGGAAALQNKNLTLQDTAEYWRAKYEDKEKELQKLQEEFSVLRSERDTATVCSMCHCNAEPPQNSNEEKILVDMDQMLYLSENIPGNNFKHVLRHLSVDDTEVTNLYHTTRDPKDCCIEGLKIWKREKGHKANMWALLQGLLKSRFRNVAEDFCREFKLHQLLTKLGQTEDQVPPSGSPLAQEREEVVRNLGADFADAPSYPPSCPTNACPLHEMLWPHLRPPPCLEDLDHELRDCDSFTPQQLEKLAKRLPNESQKEEFLTACGSKKVSTVLNEWVKRQIPEDKSSVLKLGKMLRKLARQDIREVLIPFLQMGAIGPSMDEKIYIRKLCHRTLHNLGHALSKPQPRDMHDWRCLASDIGLSDQIGILSKKELPGVEVLQVWKTSNDATVGKLYEWAVRETRWDIAKIMESDMSNNGI